MNLENFAEYLKYPSRLYQLPYEELKSLTLQYPYCANFHVLLLIKSKLEGHPDLEKNLARAATYSVDRKHLRKIMLEEELIPAESQITVGEDEILELKDLFTLDEWEKIPVEPTETDQETPSVHLSFDLPTISPEEEEIAFTPAGANDGDHPQDVPENESTPAESFSETPEVLPDPEAIPIVPEDANDHSAVGIPDASVVISGYQVPAELIAGIGSVVGITQSWSPPVAAEPEPAPELPAEPARFELPEEITADCAASTLAVSDWWEHRENASVLEWEVSPAPPPPLPAAKFKPGLAPTPKSSFQSFKKRYRRPLPKEAPPAPPAAEEILPPNAKAVAEESLREDLGVVSETLAGLLVQQHQYDRAIKMYEHLSLLIPEKNTYFAAKIDAIKNL